MNEQDYEQLTLYPADSPVNHFPLPGSAEAQKMTVTSGRKCLELLQNSDPFGLLGKMLLESSIWRSTQCYLTWKPKATPQGRLLFQLVASAPRTDDTGQQLWLTTPIAQESSAGRSKKNLGQKQNSNAERICQTVAYCEVSGKRGLPIQQGQSQQENIDAVWSGETMANADSSGCGRQQRRQNAQQPADGSWWAAEPRVGRVADGIPNRMDRIRCLGNAVVPQQFYPIFKTIAVMEGGEEDGRRNS